MDVAIQDQIPDNHCWGCGADNPQGLHLRSFWDGEQAVAALPPRCRLRRRPRHVLNGGIIATLLDCHGVCTAIARAYDDEGRAIGSEPEIWHATTSMTVEYLRPTPIGEEVELIGRVLAAEGPSTAVESRAVVRGQGTGPGDRPRGPRAGVVAPRGGLRAFPPEGPGQMRG